MKIIKENKGKTFLIVLFIILLGVESYFLFNSKKTPNKESTNNKKEIVFDENNKKYLVDVTTPYKENGLEFTVKEKSKNIYYTISGLKDKSIEDKINQKIEEKIQKLEEKYQGEEKYITGKIVGNFENILSIVFLTSDYYNDYYYETEEDCYESYPYGYEETLNIDLNTGEEFDLGDVLLKDSTLREILIAEITENAFRTVGLSYYLDRKDYSLVEDSVYSIINQYNKGNYIFSISPTHLSFHFNDVHFQNPTLFDGAESPEGLYDCETTGEGEYSYTVCYDAYDTEYEIAIPLYPLVDDVIIYDRFKSEESLFQNDSKEIQLKFTFEHGDDSDDEYVNHSFSSQENLFVDYDLEYYYEQMESAENLKNLVVKESSALNRKNGYNILNLNGHYTFIGSYDYIYYNVSSYNIDKDTFEKNKKDIYLNKFTKENHKYDFLKKYLYSEGFYFYLFNRDGEEVDVTDVLSDRYDFSAVIPEEWYSLGEYKNAEEMLNHALIMVNEDMEFPNRLVIYDGIQRDALVQYDETTQIVLKYKGRKKVLADGGEAAIALSEKLYN